ncbi:MAG: MBL fold metallo-hydrolase, partial [Patescibacteria group bacterium]
MHLTFYGASHEVTGSNFLLETGGAKILVDCGMFQGGEFNETKNQEPFPYDPAEIDAVLVTHPHYDHVGRIPKLIKKGFRGRVYMTEAASELAQLVWVDAYHIMKYAHQKRGAPLLYTEGDIDRAVRACVPVTYGKSVRIVPGISAVWKDAGHIFGSAFIEVAAEGKTVAFSGDIGNENAPILKDTMPLSPRIDVLLCESTYGDRIHESPERGREMLLSLIQEGCRRGGTILMPSFSLERTQEILYRLHVLREHDKTLPHLPIFVDSPMAIDAIAVYKKYPEYYDADALRMYSAGEDFLHFPGLALTHTKDESKRINAAPAPKMIIAGSGMMNVGRILHHAIRYLPAQKTLVNLVNHGES